MNSLNWKALEHTDISGGNRRLTVTGTIDLTNTNQTADLVERIPQGFEGTTLLLNLDLRSNGIGNPVVVKREVSYDKPIEEDQYRIVEIWLEQQRLESVQVETVLS